MTDELETKPWWKSRTILTQFVGLALAITVYAIGPEWSFLAPHIEAIVSVILVGQAIMTGIFRGLARQRIGRRTRVYRSVK